MRTKEKPDWHVDWYDTEESGEVYEAALYAVKRLSKDLRVAAETMGPAEARFLVDAYYMMQRDRVRSFHQVRTLTEGQEPHSVLQWVCDQSSIVEDQIKAALDRYSKQGVVGQWLRGVTGVGPVIAAGLLGHLDIEKAPTAGHFFAFAGLDPTVKWFDSTRTRKELERIAGATAITDASEELLDTACAWFRRRRQTIVKSLGNRPWTKAKMVAAFSKRPWNTKLKTLCWKVGQSFVKVCNKETAFYGHLYVQRKRQETQDNLAGKYADQARQKLATTNISKSTDAYKWLAGCVTPEAAKVYLAKADQRGAVPVVKVGDGVEMLPPAHIHARAMRWAVKIFLSNLHEVMYETRYDKPAPSPYPLAYLGHTHKIGGTKS